jgi:hypothetical protein
MEVNLSGSNGMITSRTERGGNSDREIQNVRVFIVLQLEEMGLCKKKAKLSLCLSN